MIALACVILVISGILLMVAAGVGPFARDPWEKYHFAYRKLAPWQQNTLITLATLIAIVSTLAIIGVFS